MKNVQIIIVLLMVLLLSACQEKMSPLVEGSVMYKSQDGLWVKKSLTQQQLQALSLWLVRNSSKWGRCFITPPSQTLSISLKHADGSSSYLAQLNFTNSQTTLMASHLSGSNLSDQPCALQSFSESEIDALHKAIDVSR
ncbi:MAG: hypothetical protein LLG40_02300 [Deltaproteobacteria bacterium]|nr:hypothetical protein [Deltaproteobacteria bacterium]